MAVRATKAGASSAAAGTPRRDVSSHAERAHAPEDAVGAHGAAEVAHAEAPRLDPLAGVLAMDGPRARVGLIVACAAALLSHAVIPVRAATALWDMLRGLQAIRASEHEFFWAAYDVEVERPHRKDEPPPPPPPEPMPDIKPEPASVAKAKADPYDTPPPPSQATKILTRETKPDEVVDQTDRGIVSGDGTGPAYGVQSASGTGTTPTMNTHAALGGKPGGTGTGAPPPPPPPAVDRSRAAGLAGDTNWGTSCPFPPEAEADQVDSAVAVIIVTVRLDGSPQSVQVVKDPGHGFGRAARMCALAHRFTPGLDKTGAPTVTTTAPIIVRFTH